MYMYQPSRRRMKLQRTSHQNTSIIELGIRCVPFGHEIRMSSHGAPRCIVQRYRLRVKQEVAQLEPSTKNGSGTVTRKESTWPMLNPEIRIELSPLQRFRRAIRTVQVLLKATASAHQSQHLNAKWLSWADVQPVKEEDSFSQYGLAFDPSFFKANRELTLSNEAKAILRLDPTERTESQLRLSLVALNQTVPQFEEFPRKMQRSLVSHGWYEHFESKRVIIRQGHYADNFYLIISGIAIVTLLETDSLTGLEKVRTASVLKKGNSFGELALMHGARRSATVTCKTNVELLAVGRDVFVDIFMHVEKDVEPDHIQFLRTLPVLNQWLIGKLPYIDHNVCVFTYFRRGTVLCHDSNNSSWIYFIKSGSCSVLKSLKATKPSTKYFGNDVRLSRPRYKVLPPITRSSASSHCTRLVTEIRHSGVDEPERSNKCQTDRVYVQVKKLVSKDTFGIEQLIFHDLSFCTSMSLISDGAECILINRKFFSKHLTDDVWKILRFSLQPYPTEQSLQQQLQEDTDWQAYKHATLHTQLQQRNKH